MSPPSGHQCDPGEGPIALTHARDRGHTGAGAGRHHHTDTVRHSVSDHHDTLTDQVRQVTHHQAVMKMIVWGRL